MPSPDLPAARPGAGPGGPGARYGRPRGGPSRRVRLVLLAVAGAVLAAVVVALALPRLTAPVGFVVRGFTVVDDDTVRVTWEVAREPGTVVECLVRARGADGAQVADELVRLPAEPGRRTVVSHDLTTAARAVTGEVRSCIRVGP